MDADHLDALARSVSTVGSRRHALAGLLAGALAFLGGHEPQGIDAAEADAEHNRLKKCNKIDDKKRRRRCKKNAKQHNASHNICPFVGLQGICTSQDQCCTSSTGTVCSVNYCRPDDLPVCCQPTGGTCTNACDCCGLFSDCVGGACV